MSIHILPNPIEQTDSPRSEEEVSPHLERYRPATFDRLLASTARLKKWQKLPALSTGKNAPLADSPQEKSERTADRLSATF